MMGTCSSRSSVDVDPEALKRHKEIEVEIIKERIAPSRKLLLLGAGECGKSTVLKQMRLRQAAFTQNELLYYKPLITGMVVTSVYSLIQAAKELESQELETMEAETNKVETIVENSCENHPVSKSVCSAISKLWKTECIQNAFRYRDRFHVNESAKYFLNDVDRVCAPDYQPTIQDILNVRAATIGVQEVCFNEKDTLIRVFDVGGQKSQRRKWIHVFDNVDAIIYICAVSEFNQTMREDQTMNRLVDSLNLFKDVANNQYFTKISLILFFNKTDLFLEKLLQNMSISSAFPEFKGPNSYEDSMQFLTNKFRSEANESDLRRVMIHETCAVDTNQIRFVLDGVADIILSRQMGKTGFE